MHWERRVGTSAPPLCLREGFSQTLNRYCYPGSFDVLDVGERIAGFRGSHHSIKYAILDMFDAVFLLRVFGVEGMSQFDTDNFELDVIRRSRDKPVLVDFWAEWCGPCRIIGPVLERLAGENGEDWELRKLDTEKYPGIARQYRITSIPAVKLFIDGEVKDEFVGALPEQMIVQWLGKALPSKFRQQLESVEALISERNFGEAHYLLSDILGNDPNDERGIVLLAQVELYSDPVRARETADRIPLGSKYFETAEAIKALSHLFQYTETPEVLDDSSVKRDYLESIRLLREGESESALEGFIGVIRRNRYFDDDGARKAVIAVFKLLGEDHETTRAYRNPFANALY